MMTGNKDTALAVCGAVPKLQSRMEKFIRKRFGLIFASLAICVSRRRFMSPWLYRFWF